MKSFDVPIIYRSPLISAIKKKWKETDKMKKDFDARLEKMTREALKDGWLKPQAVYGYFACQADGDSLIVYENAEGKKELTRFDFPRQPHDDHLALSDYYATVESGEMDVVALQVVTVGLEATEKFDKLQAAHDYTDAYFTHGLAVQAAEAMGGENAGRLGLAQSPVRKHWEMGLRLFRRHDSRGRHRLSRPCFCGLELVSRLH